MSCPVWLGLCSEPKPFPKAFITRGLEGLFPCSGSLVCTDCLAPQMFLPVYPRTHEYGTSRFPSCHFPYLLIHLCLPCHVSSPLQLPMSAPPSSLNECFFFSLSNFHTVRFSGTSAWFFFQICCSSPLVVTGGILSQKSLVPKVQGEICTFKLLF